jgi:general secretion pathway protein D
MFSDRNSSVKKTELIILITPRVVRDGAESRLVSEEYRRKMNVYTPHTSTRVLRTPVNTLLRMTVP